MRHVKIHWRNWNLTSRCRTVPVFRPLGVDWDRYTRTEELVWSQVVFNSLFLNELAECGYSQSLSSLSISFSLLVSASVSVFIHSISVPLSSFNLFSGLFTLNPAPLYTPHPNPAPWWFSAGCFHGNITFNCLRWALTFQFWWASGWKWVSCFFFFRWKNFSSFRDVIRSLCVYRSASGNFQNLPQNCMFCHFSIKVVCSRYSWKHKTVEDSVWFWWYMGLKIMFSYQKLLDEKTTLLFIEYIWFIIISCKLLLHNPLKPFWHRDCTMSPQRRPFSTPLHCVLLDSKPAFCN